MDIMGMMKKAQEMQARMGEVQAELEQAQCPGTSGGGLVTVTLNGKGAMLGTQIDPSLLKPEDAAVLEDLILAAHQNAREKVDETMKARMEEVTGGLPLPPGMKLF